MFKALDTQRPEDKPVYLADFPYVNGRLFSTDHALVVPTFTKAARAMLLGLGKLIWQEINPDIFGSMFQAIVTPGRRSDLGQHYTSVPNILKTIEPLFLDDLREAFDAAWDSAKKLRDLLDRISEIRIFDPACGSGNFLVIAYKELRRLEHAILERLADLDPSHNTLFTDSVISIEHFYGIEIDDFAVEVAILSLWIAKHQMNREFKDKFGTTIPLIPLREAGAIHAGNATRIDWNTICPNEGIAEIYLIGNPPYGGAKKIKAAQKEDYDYAFGDRPYSRNLDYIALWFIKGAAYISGTRAQLAFVSTNSVTQGEHVGLMFPMIFEMGIEIGYAYTSFKWTNNAKHNAGVTVVVISLRNATNERKYLYHEGMRTQVTNINGYLIDADDVYIRTRKQPLTRYLPAMTFGSMPRDGGNLILSETDLTDLKNTDPQAERFVKAYCGAKDFIEGNQRYCLWITDAQAREAQASPWISRCLRAVSEYRQTSDASSTAKYANRPYLFVQRAYKPTDSIIVPRVSSERREYVPIGYLSPDTVISDAANAIYDAELWLFALLTSRMHVVWLRAVGGKLKTDYRYSNTLVYNNFPVPPLTGSVKETLTQRALRVLDVREYHCEHTLAELYDPQKMPENLRQAHADLDTVVDRIYRKRPFDSDEERLNLLFDLYQQMSAEEAPAQQAATAAKRTRRTRKAQS
ncbi:MAG: class I SAM-dependent DNA methyltransferase [Pauljensenia sp.]